MLDMIGRLIELEEGLNNLITSLKYMTSPL